MLKECSMDPNETTQKLLHQDPFREVKSKRGRKKENQNKDSESRWKVGAPGRGSRGGRGNFSPHYLTHDAGGAKTSAPAMDSGSNEVTEKVIGPPLSTSQENKNKELTPAVSSVPFPANGPAGISLTSLRLSGTNQIGVSSSPTGISTLENVPSDVDVCQKPTTAFKSADKSGQSAASSNDCFMLETPSSSAVCFSSSDPVLVPLDDSSLLGTVSTIKREVGGHRTSTERNAVVPTENKLTAVSETRRSSMQGKITSKSLGGPKAQFSESSQSPSITLGGFSVSRPPSNYGSRPSQIIGPQKVGSNKEWKPKINSNVGQGSGKGDASEVPPISVEANAHPPPLSVVLDSEEAMSKLHKKLEELRLPQRQHVIIPDHIHVPESERIKFSFGSFDASFGVTSYNVRTESEKSSTPLSETCQGVGEDVEEEAMRNQNAVATAGDEDYPDNPQSPPHPSENLSAHGDVSASSIHEFSENKQKNALLSGGHQSSVVQSAHNYGFGFMPPMLESQLGPLENSESQTRDVLRLPSFAVQQPIDPASYYAQFYRPAVDNGGRVSPFPSPGVGAKYNGNAALLPPSSQSQEGANSLVQTSAGPTPPLVTQATGLVQSSLAVTQQPMPVFHPPAGVHISHYPPNFFSYGHYFSPFYVPPPAIHQFLSNGAFAQQPQAGSVYPSPPSAPITGVKFSLPQYKPGSNTGNSVHVGMPSGYGPYGSSAGYNPSSATAAGNSSTNEDLTASQFKENNVYITGQQSEGSAVWLATPGRDISTLPPNSFYNLQAQGQHVSFAPTQASPGSYSGIYQPGQGISAATVHPLLQQSQTLGGAVDMVGPAASVYQQPQHAQINWPSNY